eukprot:TRINITY_DN837_c0_g1_i2.p2 TRINITY_DN837_c0_g1~~TRINITY_DN837_c0_g1_i2.p2  ORF type:complete len:218 (-),score=50.16 TRINITY_DN837_c0_g1_i2:824-1396(-)
MGKDKYENDKLIKYGFPEDVWFHVKDLPSAHVYVRMPYGMTIDELPDEIIQNCAQICKANSKQANKLTNVKIIYTPWENLRKLPRMKPGEVDYHDKDRVREYIVAKRINSIINRFKKLAVEKFPDLAAEKKMRDRELLAEKKATLKRQREAKRIQEAANKEAEKLRSYDSLFKTSTAAYSDEEIDEDDFM